MTDKEAEKEKNVTVPVIIFLAALALVAFCLIALPKGDENNNAATENNRAPESVNDVTK